MKKNILSLFSLACLTLSVHAQTVTQTMYVDFGADNDTNRGMYTTGADAQGHYWTNVHPSGGIYIYPGTSFAIVNAANADTGYSLFFNVRFTTNGKTGGGGLLSPSADLLGDLAVASATEDYCFLESASSINQHHGFMTFRGLDPQKAYRFSTFGSRNTTEERAGWWEYRGENVWEGYQQIAGPAIGADSYNGNNNQILVSDPIFPDRDGCIRLTMKKFRPDRMLMMNAMKIEELSGLERPHQGYVLTQRLYLDVGENNNSRGHQTTGADKNGNYWNNMVSDPSGSDYIVPKGRTIDLVNAANQATGYKAEMATVMYTNGGSSAGGNTNPSDDLGDLAVATATEDYVWIAVDGKRQIRFTGLNKDHVYKFYIYGARDVNESRHSVYTLNGQSDWTTVFQASGVDIGGQGVQYNVRNVAVSDYMFPDDSGNILFTLERYNSTTYGHFNAIKIEEYSGAVRPVTHDLLREASISGTASENGADAPMHELAAGIFEGYLRLQPGTYVIKGTTTGGTAVMLGQGTESGTVEDGGTAFTVAEEQVVRVRLNTKLYTMTVTPVELYVKGNIVADGTRVEYAGNGKWESQVDMNDGSVFLFSDKYFYFQFNNDPQLAVKRLSGSRTAVAMASEGFTTENIRLNRGTYTLGLDMRNYTWSIDAPIDEYKISAFGSSVCNGQGADGNRGYAYLYGQQLSSRYRRSKSEYPFTVSGIAIGGNTTINLQNRYDELIHDFGRYVLFGLSMGNEGIHGASNQQAVLNQWRDNMLGLIAKARTDGKVPVVMNNYTRADFTESDYYYIKQLNLLIHEWDVPSVNTLGAIDDGAGHWADGYKADDYHPTTAGHQEFMYAMPPSLFDALAQGKPLPVRDASQSMTLKEGSTIGFNAESTVHPFTLSVRVKGGQAGQLMSLKSGTRYATVVADAAGKLTLTIPGGQTIVGATSIADDQWHTVTLTQYYAQDRILLYVDNVAQGELKYESSVGTHMRFAPTAFTIGDADADVSRQYGELFFWRSALNVDEVAALCQGKLLKSSLEIYAPLSDEAAAAEQIDNLAQSLNTLAYVPGVPSGIGAVQVDASSAGPLYNVVGQRVDADYKGLVIQQGRKTVAK